MNAFLSSFLQTPTKYSLALLEVSQIQKINPVGLYLPSWVTFPFKRSLCLFPLESYSFPHFTVVNFLPAQWAGEKAGLNTCFRHGSHVFLDIFLKKMVVNRYGKVRWYNCHWCDDVTLCCCFSVDKPTWCHLSRVLCYTKHHLPLISVGTKCIQCNVGLALESTGMIFLTSVCSGQGPWWPAVNLWCHLNPSECAWVISVVLRQSQ